MNLSAFIGIPVRVKMPIIQFSLLQLLFLFYLSLTLLKKDSLSKSMNQKGFVQIPLLIATIISIVLIAAVISYREISNPKSNITTIAPTTMSSLFRPNYYLQTTTITIPATVLPTTTIVPFITTTKPPPTTIILKVDCSKILLSVDELQEITDKMNQVDKETGGLDANSLKKLFYTLEAAYKTNKVPSCKAYFDKELREKEAALDSNQTENATPPVSISNFAGYIVRVICTNGNKDNPTFSSGSGTIFGLNRFVITNSHVVEGMVLCSIGLTDDIKSPPSRWYEATIAQNISSLDIALLEPTQSLPSNVNTVAYNLCNPDAINLGDSVMVLGYPIVGGNTITATEGVISGFDGFLVKTSAKIEHGNSGGGAFLKDKNCWFGIPTSVAQGELESLGFIINYSLIHQKSSQ